MTKLRVFEAFSGYGSQSIALENIGVEHEVVAISEIDKYAIKAYYATHDNNIPNLGDISKINVDDIPEHDLFTYSFPCTDISVCGKREGIIKGKTRSGLLYECERIIEHCRPKYLLLENVKNLVGKNFKKQFDEWLIYLESLGYTNYWKVLNAKDYANIPQNRERVFVISILGNHKEYTFPSKIQLTKQIKDVIENDVDNKYYLSEDVQERFRQAYPMCINNTPSNNIENIGMLDIKGNEQVRRVYGINGVSPTLNTMQGGNTQPKILIPNKELLVDVPCICASRGRNSINPSDRVGAYTEQRFEVNTKGVSNTITTVQKDNYIICEQRTDEGLRFFKDNVCGTIRTISNGGDKRIIELSNNTFRIRKLTPTECFRLMGLDDNRIKLIQDTGISNTQQYKMAGNSIVVQVLERIFNNLFINV